MASKFGVTFASSGPFDYVGTGEFDNRNGHIPADYRGATLCNPEHSAQR